MFGFVVVLALRCAFCVFLCGFGIFWDFLVATNVIGSVFCWAVSVGVVSVSYDRSRSALVMRMADSDCLPHTQRLTPPPQKTHPYRHHRLPASPLLPLLRPLRLRLP